MTSREMTDDERAQYRFMQYMMVGELEPLFRKYFSQGPVGMLACYSVASKLKMGYFEALRAIATDKDEFDRRIKQIDEEESNLSAFAGKRELLEAFAKAFMGAKDKYDQSQSQK